jgi:hypothetical protein
VEAAVRAAWKSCGGPLDDVPQLFHLLIAAELLTVRNGRLRTTRSGQQVATQDHQQGGRLLALALIRAGLFANQARNLTEVAAADSNSGNLVCRRARAVAAAPQLVGLLRRFPGVTLTDTLVVPQEVAAELADLWRVPRRPRRDDLRKEVGDRGELYSYRHVQMQAANPSKVRWVALDDDTLGYDIEDVGTCPRRCIEVKASTGTAVRFLLSVNEWKVAHQQGANYEVHFWGGVNLAHDARDDYERLRKAGFPIVYRDLPTLLSVGTLNAAAAQYVVVATKETVA